MRKIVLSAVLTVAMALPVLAHFPPGEFFFAVQFPDANVPVIDGNHADWGVVPQVPYEVGNDRYSDSVYSKLRGEIDVSDLSVRQVVGWNDNTNLLYFMAEVFDNVHSRDAETPNAWWADDAWEIYINPTHAEIDGGGGYAPGQEGIIKIGYNFSMPPTAGAWGGYNPPFDWVTDPANNDAWSMAYTFSGEEFGESTYIYEFAVQPISSMPKNNEATEDQVNIHDLSEGETIHIGIIVNEVDGGEGEGDNRIGQWGTQVEGCCHADMDLLIAPVDPDILWPTATAVEAASWGMIKAQY